ncbi:ester cyclase [Nocardia sp. NRRL S-836]|uniref:ester cyclase n=1 Tax=Nocardia sp. NRRL S-836 TaxID=1519492 RepID=UPI0006AEA6B4|nr:ester cyclase [Nocardia sp. NRRL S-836]KOV84162.1 ester cyclase [Nocardia sp. NRRL S-836]
MTESKALRALREAIVLELIESQNEYDFDAGLTTFNHPRFEIMATGQVLDGVDAVRDYWKRTRAAFPDQKNKVIEVYHADDAVIVEFELQGTHLGSLTGEPVTGKTFKVRMSGFFLFDKDVLVCERVYGDSATVLHQLGLIEAPQEY